MGSQASSSGGFIDNMLDNPKNKNPSSIKLRSGVESSTQKTIHEREEDTCTPLDEITELGMKNMR